MHRTFVPNPQYLAIAAGCGMAVLAYGLPVSRDCGAYAGQWLERANHEKTFEIKRPEVMSV
jgi:hypothetical protein